MNKLYLEIRSNLMEQIRKVRCNGDIPASEFILIANCRTCPPFDMNGPL